MGNDELPGEGSPSQRDVFEINKTNNKFKERTDYVRT
jgi:hypothetical protein